MDLVVRIVLALLSLLTANRPGGGQGRTAAAWSGAPGPYPSGPFGAGHTTAVRAGPAAARRPRPARLPSRRGRAARPAGHRPGGRLTPVPARAGGGCAPGLSGARSWCWPGSSSARRSRPWCWPRSRPPCTSWA